MGTLGLQLSSSGVCRGSDSTVRNGVPSARDRDLVVRAAWRHVIDIKTMKYSYWRTWVRPTTRSATLGIGVATRRSCEWLSK